METLDCTTEVRTAVRIATYRLWVGAGQAPASVGRVWAANVNPCRPLLTVKWALKAGLCTAVFKKENNAVLTYVQLQL